MNKPQPKLLTIWRILLTLSAAIPAFLISLLLRAGSRVWAFSAGGLVLLYLFMYLVYFPIRYKKTSFGISGENFVLTTGVITTRVIAVPISHIQFTTVGQTVLSRLFGISHVIATIPGGRVAVPGLKAADADNLAFALRPSRTKGGV